VSDVIPEPTPPEQPRKQGRPPGPRKQQPYNPDVPRWMSEEAKRRGNYSVPAYITRLMMVAASKRHRAPGNLCSWLLHNWLLRQGLHKNMTEDQLKAWHDEPPRKRGT
jgi:hypothetical protein